MTKKNTQSEDKALEIAKETLAPVKVDHSRKSEAEVEATSKAKEKSSAKAAKPKVEITPETSAKKPSKASKKSAAPGKTKAAAAKTSKKTSAPSKKAATGDAPTSGQSGPKIKIEKEELNEKEVKVLTALRRAKNGLPLAELAERVFPRKPKAQANSWVRNSLRRLVRARFVKRADRGEYLALKAA